MSPLHHLTRPTWIYPAVFILILMMSLALRLFGQGWDQGLHLHPDERMLIMVTDRIHFPDHLNPDFFNYGSLPIYLLRGLTQVVEIMTRPFANYDTLLPFGRTLSALMDLGTAILVYHLSYQLTKQRVLALWAMFFYSIAFFPIQNSHFFVVDVPMTFFTTLLVYLLLRYVAKPTIGILILLSLVSGAGFATKFTFILFLPVCAVVIAIASMSSRTRFGIFRDSKVVRVLCFVLLYAMLALIFHFICMPYAYLEPTGILSHPSDIFRMFSLTDMPLTVRYLRDIREQTRMNTDAYIFPYTLQYVYTRAYTYPLWNIWMWGLGPWISILAAIGAMRSLLTLRTPCHPEFISGSFNGREVEGGERSCTDLGECPRERSRNSGLLSVRDDRWRRACKIKRKLIIFILVAIYGFYFVVIGKSAVKFMRYMLPLYPLFAISAAYGVTYLFARGRSRRYLGPAVGLILIAGATLWTAAFMRIYQLPHPRIQATDWMLAHIPPGATLATEHWDDRLPLRGGERYQYIELPMYETFMPGRLQQAQASLQQADYLVLASNRLYTPLQQLADCERYLRCYPETAKFYQDLLSDKTNFKKIAEFTTYPRFSIGPWQWDIPDDDADESFTVYDHPQVIIFKKQ